jgi:hypothetical protein
MYNKKGLELYFNPFFIVVILLHGKKDKNIHS